MFERFTDQARSVVVMAQEEARLLSHNYIGTEHLLLALLGQRDGVAADVLADQGVSLERTRQAVLDIVGEGGAPPQGQIPFTPRAKKVLELSLREALQLGDQHIGAEHILLGVVREGEGMAAQVLVNQGVSLPGLRMAVHQATGTGPTAATGPRRRFLRRRIAGPEAPMLRVTPGGDAVRRRARELAGDDLVRSDHYLQAIVEQPDTVAARALASLGADAEKVTAAIAATPRAGTTDETAEDVAARSVELRHEGDRVVIEVADPALAEALRTANQGEIIAVLANLVEEIRRTSGGQAGAPPA
jgi:ATP-dependent Clp protease ATP-binding subunit ClpC